MRKTVALLIAVLFVSVIAATAFATDTSFEGEYRVRALVEWNFDKKPGYYPPDLEPQHDGWFDQRFRLTITHTRSEYLKAVIRLDIVEDTWGQGRAFWINNTAAGNYIDWAYLEFTLPPIGTFTIGKFPETYGHGIIFGTDGQDGARWENTWGPVTASLLYFKVQDNVTLGAGNRFYNRDTNLYALNLNFIPAEGHEIELYGGLFIANDTVFAASRDYLLNYTNRVFANPFESAMTLGFFGLAYTGSIMDMIDLKFEYGWVLGDVRYDAYYPPADAGGTNYSSATVEGWSLYLDVAYYNELFRVGVAFIMGSGGLNYWGPQQYNNVNMNSISNTPTGIGWGNIIGSGRSFSNSRNLWAGPGWQRNAENLTSVKLYFEICPMEKLTLNAAVIWAKWTNPVGWNDQPNGVATWNVYPHPMRILATSNYNYTSWDESTDLGWEIDFGLSYEIMEGLTYTFSAGVLLPGSSFDYVDYDGTRASWGPIWSISNELLYEF